MTVMQIIDYLNYFMITGQLKEIDKLLEDNKSIRNIILSYMTMEWHQKYLGKKTIAVGGRINGIKFMKEVK